jgi:YVTN family beta-propeller protein
MTKLSHEANGDCVEQKLGHQPVSKGFGKLLLAAVVLIFTVSSLSVGSGAIFGSSAAVAYPSLAPHQVAVVSSPATGSGDVGPACTGCPVVNISVGIAPRGLAFVPSNAQLFVADPESTIIVSGTTDSVIGQVSTATGNFSQSDVYDPLNGQVYVAEYDSNNIVAINSTSDQIMALIPVGLNPFGIAVDSVSGYVYVSDTNSSNVSVINGSTDKVVGNINVGGFPTSIAFDSMNDRLYVANRNLYDVTVISGANNTIIGAIPVGLNPWGITFDSSNGYLYVANYWSNTVTVINGSSDAVLGTLPVGAGPWLIGYDASNRLVYVTEPGISYTDSLVSVISGVQVIENITVGTGPWGINFNPANGQVFVSNVRSGTVTVIGNSSTVVSPLHAELLFDTSNSGTVPLTVGMTGNASGGEPPYSFGWTFGDGSAGSGATVTHTYTAVGTYDVTLVVKDSSGASINASGIISVRPQNSSNLALSIVFDSPSVGYLPLTVTLSGIASGGNPPYVYSWTLGDGSTASGQLVSHTYTVFPSGCSGSQSACAYTIDATVTDSNRSAVSTSAQVVVLRGNSSAFQTSMSDSPAVGVAPLHVSFNGSASGGMSPYNFVWAFGDGFTGEGVTAQHEYHTPGTYTVVLTGVDAQGAVAQSTSTIVVYPAPNQSDPNSIELSVRASPVTGMAPLSTNLSVSAVGGTGSYTYVWNFGDGSTPVSSPSVSHRYLLPSEYVATVVATDSAGHQTTTGVLINALNGASQVSNLAVAVTVVDMSGNAPHTVTFYPAIEGGSAPYRLTWNFGDGTSLSSLGGAVTHLYSKPGSYSPTLTVQDSSGHNAVWSLNSPGFSHPVVIGSGASTLGNSNVDWYIIIAVIVGIVALCAVALRNRKIPRKPAYLRGQPAILHDSNDRYHDFASTMPGESANPLSGTPQATRAPASSTDDPLGNII